MDLEKTFKNRLLGLEELFSSYSALHDIYAGALKSAGANQNLQRAFSGVGGTVREKELKISNTLYTQGFILMTGAAEALLKNIFEDLLIYNFEHVTGANGISFNIREVQEAVASAKKLSDETSIPPLQALGIRLGRGAHDRIYDSQNPSEKINFQNVQSMQDVFKRYFSIEIPDSEDLRWLHRYWQTRHLLVHNDAIINKRFVHNVEVVGLKRPTDKLERKVVVNKQDYRDAEGKFLALFATLEKLIAEKGAFVFLLDRDIEDE